MALHDENLKMDKDVRGIERGKCAFGEWEDFMMSDGATCGYCGCLPTRHSKKDATPTSEPDDFQPRPQIKAGVHLKAVLTSLNKAFLPISRSRFKQR